MGLLVALRQSGGSIGPAACSAVYTNKITEKLPAYIASAALAAGLPASSLSTFVPALAGGNATLAAQSTGANAAIIGAAGAAATQAYVDSFRFGPSASHRDHRADFAQSGTSSSVRDRLGA